VVVIEAGYGLPDGAEVKVEDPAPPEARNAPDGDEHK
jgi:hypothetical protein